MKKVILFLIILVLSGCGDIKDPEYMVGEPFDSTKIFVLETDNIGIHPDTSILDSTYNLFTGFNVRADYTLKWDIQNLSSNYAWYKFFCWAKVLAHEAWGEPQFYVGKALQELALNPYFTTPEIKAHAIKAYQNCLDYFFDAQSYSSGGVPFPLNILCYDGIIKLGGVPEGCTVVESEPYVDPDNVNGATRVDRYVIKTKN